MDVQTRRAIPFEEADTATLRQALSHYANPDNKIGDLVRRGEILRVHKGLYAIAPEFRQAPLPWKSWPIVCTALPTSLWSTRFHGIR